MRFLRKFSSRLREMSAPAYIILRLGALLSSAMLLASLAILLLAGAPNAGNHRLLRLAEQLYRTPAAVLLIAVVGSVCVEDVIAGR